VYALRVADMAIIPVQPAGLDVWTLGLIDDEVADGGPARTHANHHTEGRQGERFRDPQAAA